MTMYAYKTDDGGNYRLGHKAYATRHVVHFPVYLGSCKPDHDVELFGYVDLVCGSQEILPKQTPVTNSMVALYAKDAVLLPNIACMELTFTVATLEAISGKVPLLKLNNVFDSPYKTTTAD